MAQVILGGAAGGVRNVFRDVRTHVYAKRAVSDDWTYLPYLHCVRCDVQAGPGVGTAEFQWQFGEVARAETRVFEIFGPYLLNRAYVKVEVGNGYAREAVWYGVVESDQVRPHGNSGVTHGRQTFTAYELSHLLDRGAVVGSYITLPSGAQYIDETLVFNGAQNGRRELYKNRLNGVFGANASAQLWDAWSVLDYVFTRFVNSNWGIQFVGHGTAQAALETMWERWDFRGMTAKQILDTLVDRKKGLGWRLTPEDDLSVVYVHVFSQLAEDVAVGEGYVPANENQTDIQFAGYRDVEPVYHFGELSHYDTVRVQGGPIYSTASYSFADGTLEPHWTTTQENTYKDGSDKEGATSAEHDLRRKEVDLAAVYQRFKVPDGWDGLVGDGEGGAKVSALPRCYEDGVIDTDAVGYGWRGGKRFERELPWETARGDDVWSETNAELLLALFKYTDPAPIDPEDVGEIWSKAEDLYQLGMQGARVTPEDTDLAVSVDYIINHYFGLNHFDPETAAASAYSPAIDYTSLVVTARLRTDERLKLSARVPTVPWAETGKTKDIFLPDAIAEYVCPGTITAIVDGAPARTTSGFLRDDTYRLGQVLALAVAFYGLVRCTLSFESGKFSMAYPVGTLVRNTVGPEGVTGVGTVVTRQAWDFASGAQKTSWATGYEELDFARAGAGGEG